MFRKKAIYPKKIIFNEQNHIIKSEKLSREVKHV